jgi:flagellar assembly protein FliH
MSSLEQVLPWRPPDFDPAPTSGSATAVRTLVAGTATAAAATAARVTYPSAPSAGWTPPALEERRPGPRPPVRSEREHGFDAGYAAGLAAGRDQGEASVDPALRALEGIVQRLQAAEAEFAQERERNLTAVALVVARKLVQQEIEVRPEVLQTLVNRAIELVPAGTVTEVRMNPADLEALVPGIEQLALENRAPAVQWVGDPQLSRGSFMVDSPTRIVDGRVDTALRQLFERIEHD